MNKKVLIFGLGQQGTKYVNYFLKKGYEVFGISKSGKSSLLDAGHTFKFSQKSVKILQQDHSFDYIILAVQPIKSQTKILSQLLHIGNKLIVEKPFTYDEGLLKDCIDKQHIYFFIDEIFFCKFMQKIIGSKVDIICSDKHTSQHAISAILAREDFQDLDISMHTSNPDGNYDLFYKIISHPYVWECRGGEIYLNNKHIGSVLFEKSLDYISSMSIIEQTLIKRNFYHFRENFEPKI